MAWQGSKTNTAQTSQTTTTEPPSGSVSVQIGGQKLTVKSDKDPQLVADIAAYVDEKVGTLRELAPSVALDKLLILASMTVAEELFDTRARLNFLETSLRDRVNNCLAVMDDVDADVS